MDHIDPEPAVATPLGEDEDMAEHLAVDVRYERLTPLPWLQLLDVVRAEAVQELHPIATGHFDLHTVGNIEEELIVGHFWSAAIHRRFHLRRSRFCYSISDSHHITKKAASPQGKAAMNRRTPN